MFKTGKTFLEYIFLLHGPPAVFRNKKIKKRQLLLHFISRFLLKQKVITLPPRGDDSNALSLPKWEDSPADCGASFCTNYPPHVVHPQAFNLRPQTTPLFVFPSSLQLTGSSTAKLQHGPLCLWWLCTAIKEEKGGRKRGMMTRGREKECGRGRARERNKDINNVFSQRDDPWPSRGIWFIWLSG